MHLDQKKQMNIRHGRIWISQFSFLFFRFLFLKSCKDATAIMNHISDAASDKCSEKKKKKSKAKTDNVIITFSLEHCF